MRWIAGRLSAFFAAFLAVVAGGAGSQASAFANAYLQRLGGHIDEARRYLESLRAGEMSRIVTEPAARDQLLAVFQRRITELEAARDAIRESGAFARPVVLFINADREIAAATLDGFVPALPFDLPSLAWALVGIAAGWLLWEAVRWPFTRRRTSERLRQ